MLTSPMPDTTTLVLETSTSLGSLALIPPTGSPVCHSFGSDRSHNTGIFPPLQQLFADHPGLEITQVLVGSGPGSYSGTRVGIAAAQGIAIAHHCPAIAVPSILAIPATDHGAPVLVIGDARRGSYWTAHIHHFRLLTEPSLTDLPGLTATVANAHASGAAIVSFENPDRFPLPSHLQSAIRLENPDALRLSRAWLENDTATRARWTATQPQPLYLKPPHITASKRPPLVP